MRRRTLLKGMAATTALAGLTLVLPAQAKLSGVMRRVRPSDPGWPGVAEWKRLKDAVGGNLIQVRSLFGACEADPKGAACLDATKSIGNPFYIGDQPGGTQVSGWLDAWTPEPSVYAVKARSSADVVAAVNFARDNNLRLVVKGAGHSYQGTSNAADSLLVWTRAMNAVTLHDSFVPKGCEGKVAPVPAVTTEAGAVWIDLYHAVTTEAGRYVQGGGCTDVGVAGLIQSGGFGSSSKGFGTAASSLLEAEIVTADGVTRTVNACSDPDLFWAIKGGGGGCWGVVTKLTLRTYDLPEFFGAAWGTIKAKSDDAFRNLLAHVIDFYADNLFNPHWGEQISILPNNTVKLSMACQGLTKQQAKQAWQPFFDWVSALPHDISVTDKLGAGATNARHWWDVAGNPSMIPDKRDGAPNYHGWWEGDEGQVGAFLHGYDSLWLPASLLLGNQRQRLADALFAGSRYKKIDLHFNKGLAGAPLDVIAAAKDTATNPAVLDAFALAIIADGEGPAYKGQTGAAMDLDAAHKDARLIDLATAELRKIAPDGGSYVSESNYFNPIWQRAFWGTNYPRLQAVKAKYDPGGLFFVHHGVGSEAWSADGFTRVGKQ
ncbi:MAG: FAD-binding oxidoreductase [Proteobacteria bacterium]|nr:FAD-binding oxidoreductase [Pseudomonadota bacterium]